MAQNVFVNPKVAPVHDSDKDRRQGHAGGGGGSLKGFLRAAGIATR